MVVLLFILSPGMLPAASQSAVELCRPALARKAGGEIAMIDVADSRSGHGGLTIEGRLTAYARMGPAPAGVARTHHVGRFDFNYRCEVRNGRVRKTRVTLFNP